MLLCKILCNKGFPGSRFMTVSHLTQIQLLRHTKHTERCAFQFPAVYADILIAAVFSCALIYYFYKKDPLRLREKEIASVDAIAVMSEKYGLSQREREVIELLNSGLSNPQIAEKLFISENTVKRHINSIFRKTGTANRHEVLFKIANINKVNI